MHETAQEDVVMSRVSDARLDQSGNPLGIRLNGIGGYVAHQGDPSAAKEVTVTLLAITHRMPSAAAADRVLVLGDAGIVEEARPLELQARGGAFARLFG
jgi:hypothetical protein